MSCPTIVVEDQTFPIITSFSEPAPIGVSLVAPSVLDFSLSTPASLQFTLVPAPIINVDMPGVGVQGPQGPVGPRGSLFLGGYPSFGNLPTPDGINVKIGDFALVQDTATIYELE